MNKIYLDFNASTPLDEKVLKAMIEELEAPPGNSSSVHSHGKRCRRVLENCRKRIADFFSVKPNEIIFTSGGTEGAAMLIGGILMKNPGKHAISSTCEHASVFGTLKEFEKNGTSVTFLPVGEKGSIDVEQAEAAIRPDTCLIALIAANNETGVMTDIQAVAEIARMKGIPFIVDGVALLGKEAFSLSPGVTGMFFSGHKIYAPKGIGFCICRSSLKLNPLFVGGGQEFNRRAGTENLPAIVALAEAVSLLAVDSEEQMNRLRHLRDLFESRLLSELPSVTINGTGPRISNTSNLAFSGSDGETLLMNLDLEGISASHGSACSSGSLEPSRILLAMGLSPDRVNASVRFSFGRTTTREEIEKASDIIVKIVRRLKSHSR